MQCPKTDGSVDISLVDISRVAVKEEALLPAPRVLGKRRSGAVKDALHTTMLGEMTQGQRDMQSLVRAANASARAQGSMEPVTLVASDGSEIIIDRKAAMVSGTIKSMLAGPGELVLSALTLRPRATNHLHPRSAAHGVASPLVFLSCCAHAACARS